jgi:septum site-determining protein MinC
LAKIEFKGQNGGLVVVFGPGSFQEYIDILKSRFESNPQMFKGFSVSFRGDDLKNLTTEETAALQRLCLDYGMVIAAPHLNKPARENTSKDIVVYKTLRSGQTLASEGSVVIWGDVHESAEVIAAKDVIVLGRLEGVAHAGCLGEINSLVFALRLFPRQIRIGNLISQPPSDYVRNDFPEVAFVEDGIICVKEYNLFNPLRKLG